MKYMKTTAIPATTRESVDFVACDLCKSKIVPSGLSVYAVDEVEVCHRTGRCYPEGGNEEVVLVDMCGKCFDEKLLPWLRSHGAEPRTEERDW